MVSWELDRLESLDGVTEPLRVEPQGCFKVVGELLLHWVVVESDRKSQWSRYVNQLLREIKMMAACSVYMKAHPLWLDWYGPEGDGTHKSEEERRCVIM